MESITQKDFESLVVQASHDTPIALMVSATWCQPCKSLKKVLDELKPEPKCRMYTIDLEDAVSLNEIMSVPTVLLYHKGKVMAKFTGSGSDTINAFRNIEKFCD